MTVLLHTHVYVHSFQKIKYFSALLSEMYRSEIESQLKNNDKNLLERSFLEINKKMFRISTSISYDCMYLVDFQPFLQEK